MQLGDIASLRLGRRLANAREITVARPVAKLSLEDYDLGKRLMEPSTQPPSRRVHLRPSRFWENHALAQAIAEYLDTDVGALVKTVEISKIYNLPTMRSTLLWRGTWKKPRKSSSSSVPIS